MKSASKIRKKYVFNNIQILSYGELQIKYESILSSIKPKDILQDLSFFQDITKFFDTSNSNKTFLLYKFSLYCFLLINYNQENFFKELFLKYVKIFIKSSDKSDKYYIFIIIKICINEIFKGMNKIISVSEFNKAINNLIEDYKRNPYDNILDLNINNFIKDDLNKTFFLFFIDSFKFPFNKDQIKAFSKYIFDNSNYISTKILDNQKSKISFFKKTNNIIQSHIKEINNLITNNNSKGNVKIIWKIFS